MRTIRSYLSNKDIPQVQSHSYQRLASTAGTTYGSAYKRRYGAVKAETTDIKTGQSETTAGINEAAETAVENQAQEGHIAARGAETSQDRLAA